jgi:hypothetical protein
MHQIGKEQDAVEGISGRWMRLAWGWLVIVALAACSERTAADEELSLPGTLRVVVSGHSPMLGNAGEVQFTDGEPGRVVAVPTAGILEELLPPGTYALTYVPPSGYLLTAGMQPHRTITMTTGGLIEVAFLVVAAPPVVPGIIALSVTGLGAGAASGGTAVVERTDVLGHASVTVGVPSSGASDLEVAVGTYQVTYAPPGGHEVASGQSNPRDATVAAGQTVPVSFAVTQIAAPDPVGIVFFSDWPIAGTSNAAKTDSGKWDSVPSEFRAIDIIPGADVGLPGSNVARVRALHLTGGYSRLTRQGLGIPEIGHSMYFRWYWRLDMPFNQCDNGFHPIESDQLPLEWTFDVLIRNETTYTLSFRTPSAGAQRTWWSWNQPAQRNVWYRVEMQIHRLGQTTFNMHARLYDLAGNLLADDDDFNNLYDTGSVTATLADRPTLTSSTSNFAALDRLRAGNNSVFCSNNDYEDGVVHSYQARFAVRQSSGQDDWIGPYTASY